MYLGSPLHWPRLRRAVPARLRPKPPHGIAGDSGTVRKKVCVLKARATYAKAERLDSPSPPCKPHPGGPLRRWSAREAAGKVTSQEGAGGEGAELAATAERLPGPQAHAMQIRSAVPE
ncbi:hypothetical protein NDU88_003516 [Pleurodeles waltl]|uniref:Uncharacterized protein n=1 Tax=Pleurodeles waltl TaxID=8319 RepID=A0AAV7SGA7_PLEWA|nr:hypothetical protein NDU88_003516 [Pleurodeles waltl]